MNDHLLTAPVSRAILLVSCIFLAIPGPARGQEEAAGAPADGPEQQAEVLLKQAEQAYESLEYEEALRILIQVQQFPDLTAIQKARTYLYMGVAFTALGRAENAVQAFMEVLKVRPEFRLPPGVSPSIRAMFSQALQRMNLPEQPAAGEQPATGEGGEEEEALSIDASAPRRVVAGRPIEIRIAISDPQKQAREVLIYWRRRQGLDYSKIKLEYVPGSKDLSGSIPAAALSGRGGNVLYYVEARDATGKVVATDGSEADPKQVVLTAEDEGEKKGTPKWVWWTVGVGGGVAAVAAAVVAGVLIANAADGGDSAKLTVVVE